MSRLLDRKLENGTGVSVKITLDIPDDLLRSVNMRAVQDGRKSNDVAVEIFRRGLAQPKPAANPVGRQRVKLPLIQCRHPAPIQPNPQAPIIYPHLFTSIPCDRPSRRNSFSMCCRITRRTSWRSSWRTRARNVMKRRWNAAPR